MLRKLVAVAANMTLLLPQFIRRRMIRVGLGLVRGLLRRSVHIPFMRRFGATIIDVHLRSELASARSRMTGSLIAPFRLLACDSGLYTGRMINVKGPVDLSEIGIECSEPRACEAKFRAWFEERGYVMLERMAYEDPQAGLPHYMRPLAHEFTHWLCFKETSMATLVDMISWRIRVDMMSLSELVHLRTGLPRLYQASMTGDAARNLLSTYANSLDSLARVDSAQMIFSDAVAHHGFSVGFYPRIVAPIIEPATWALVEPTWTATQKDQQNVLDLYFSDDEQSRRIAADVLGESILFLKTGGTQRRRELMRTVNETMNVPLHKLRDHVRNGELSGLQLELAERFKAVLAGKGVAQASATDRSFSSVIQYMLTDRYKSEGKATDVRCIEVISGMLSREPEVARYITDTLSNVFLTSQSYGVYSKPTVFLGTSVAGEYVTLRYDPLAGLTSDKPTQMDNVTVRCTGRTFGTLEDIVGDSPLSIRTCFLLLMYFNAANYQELLNGLGYPLNYLADKENAWALYQNVIGELRAVAVEKHLGYPDHLELRHFLDFWLYYVLRMGTYAKYLHGFHGMWT